MTDGLLGPTDLRQLAATLGIAPSKALGQHFLHDPNTIRRIVRIAALRPDDVVVEVGPGLGSLTLGLLPACAAVVAVEVDHTLASALPSTVEARLPEHAVRLRVVEGDALRLPGLPGPAATRLVANLPYNVAVPVLLHLLAQLPALRGGVVMVQAEVADRLAAQPGGPAYGSPSVKLRWYADVRRAGAVSRHVFWPEPNVDSGLVAFDRRDPPRGTDREAVFAAVDAAFGQRRKTLRAALAGWAGSPARAEAVLRSAAVDPGARGETLDVADYVRIAAAAVQV